MIENNVDNETFIQVLNQQNNFGNIFLFNLIEKNHHDLAVKILKKYFSLFDLSIKNYNGNTFLHYLMQINIYNKDIYNLIIQVINFNKYFIISENNQGLTPFHIGVLNKCNDSLYLMTNYFPLEQIEILSQKGSILHFASITNSTSTLRLIVEIFKLDINSQIHNNNNKKHIDNKISPFNLPNKSTPIYCAGLFSCLNSFEYLLSLGANPFIPDEDGNDAIDIALIYGDRKMLNYISKTYSFINSNGKYLLSLVKNAQARFILYDYFFILNSDGINITNSLQQNLLMLSIENHNYKIIPFLLNKKINIEHKDIFGHNVLHYCIKTNSITSCWLILSHLYSYNKKEIIYNLIYKIDDNDETSLYIASKTGRLEILYLMLLFTELYNLDYKIRINKNGLLPIHISLINENYTITLLLKKFFGIENGEIDKIPQKYKEKLVKFRNSNLKKENEKAKKIMKYLEKQIRNFQDIPLFIKKYGINEHIENENIIIEDIINLKDYNDFTKLFNNELSNKNFVKYQDLLNINLIGFLYELYLINDFSNDVKNFFKIISSLEINENYKSSIQWKLLALFTKYVIPSEYFKLCQINQYLEKLLYNSKLIKLNPSHPLFYWIDSIVISGSEGNCKIAIEDLLDIIMTFIDIILKEEEFLNNLNFVKLSMKAFQFIK